MGLFFKDTSTDLVSVLVLVASVIYFYLRYRYSYWTRRGVISIPATFPFGNFRKTFLQQISIGELAEEFYRSTKEPFIGVYGALRPTLVLRDPEIIRNVLVKDFQHFVDRGLYSDEKRDPLSAHLFNLNGDEWKNLRIKLSPTFTSGKLKAMFSTLVDCGTPLQKFIDNATSSSQTVEVRELSARYATDVIASVAFGNEINCIENPDTSFRRYGRKVFDTNLKNGLRFLLAFIAPSVMKFFHIRQFDQDVEDFMKSLVQKTLEFREKSNVVRKDFFQLLVQLRNTGNVQLDDQWETVITNDEKGKALTLNQVTAQAFVFYLAGFETSSTTMSFCLYEIAKNPNVQRKIHEEIDCVLAKHNGKITYESVSEMKYLESCIDETLRMYPAVPILNRICTKEYHIPNTNVTVEEGTAIIIPALALQRDEKYFPEPKKFIPERFAPDVARKPFNESPYMPFGEGPRICIGLRMGKLQTKVGLILMMQKYKYALSAKLKNRELVMSPAAILMCPVGGLDLEISKR